MNTTTIAPFAMSRFRNKHGYEFDAIEIDGLLVSFRDKDNDGRSRNAAARVFGACDELVADLNALEPDYIAFTDEDSTDAQRVQEAVWRAWRDATKRVAQERMIALLSRIADAGARHPKHGDVMIPAAVLEKVRFSYTAGCSCPCSPGFVLGGRVWMGYTPQDVSIGGTAGLERVA